MSVVESRLNEIFKIFHDSPYTFLDSINPKTHSLKPDISPGQLSSTPQFMYTKKKKIGRMRTLAKKKRIYNIPQTVFRECRIKLIDWAVYYNFIIFVQARSAQCLASVT